MDSGAELVNLFDSNLLLPSLITGHGYFLITGRRWVRIKVKFLGLPEPGPGKNTVCKVCRPDTQFHTAAS